MAPVRLELQKFLSYGTEAPPLEEPDEVEEIRVQRRPQAARQQVQKPKRVRRRRECVEEQRAQGREAIVGARQ